MNKQINSINGYTCVQVKVKVQFYDFSKQSACDVLTHAFYSPPPTIKTCMKPCLPNMYLENTSKMLFTMVDGDDDIRLHTSDMLW